MRTWALFVCSCLLILLAGCGGSNGVVPAPTTTTPTPAPSTSGAANPPPANPHVVTVAGGQAVGGADIDVVPPADTPQVNAEMLGVADINSGGSAQNVGDKIHRGANMKVILFGPGLNGSMTVSIGGPPDISVSNIRSVMSTDNTPGLEFDVAVSSGAALGARTVILKSAKNDVTTFTGGLEVVQ